jgi:nucleotide-binding universal stress UspA family protein
MFHPHLILHPTDYSEASAQAFEIAADLARQHQAKMLILHVAETLGAENVTFGEAASQLEPASYRRRLEDDLRRTVPAPVGISVEYLLVAGDIAAEIQHTAQERGCDLIVMATHGRTGLSHWVMGSIAEKIIRLAPCPVLTIKIPQVKTSPAPQTLSFGRDALAKREDTLR